MGLGSGTWYPEKTYSGSRIQGSKRHRIPDLDPQHWLIEVNGVYLRAREEGYRTPGELGFVVLPRHPVLDPLLPLLRHSLHIPADSHILQFSFFLRFCSQWGRILIEHFKKYTAVLLASIIFAHYIKGLSILPCFKVILLRYLGNNFHSNSK